MAGYVLASNGERIDGFSAYASGHVAHVAGDALYTFVVGQYWDL